MAYNNNLITLQGFCGSGIRDQLQWPVLKVSLDISVRRWLGLPSSEESTGAGGSALTWLTLVPGKMALLLAEIVSLHGTT